MTPVTTTIANWQLLAKKAPALILLYGQHVVYALVIFFIGWWIAKGLRRAVREVLKRRKLDATVRHFLSQSVYIAVMIFVIVAVLSQIGVATATLVASVGAIGLAISLSLRNSLGNLASGILLLINHPFKAGHFVDVGNTLGTVEKITLWFTILKTGDNQTVSMPNSQVMSNKIVNYSERGTRRINLTVGIGYNDDIKKAKKVLEAIAKKDKRVLVDPAPMVAVAELADSSVNLTFRAWTKTSDYWATRWACMEAIKLTFDQEGISIPYPQQDIHLDKD